MGSAVARVLLATLLGISGVAVGFAARRNALSTERVLALFQDKVTDGPVWRMDVYYTHWSALMIAVSPEELQRNTWTCKTAVKVPKLESLAKALESMELKPLAQPAYDHRLSCVVPHLDETTDLELSFTKYPLSVCINGRFFKPSWELFVAVSEYLPQEVRDEFIQALRRTCQAQGYPPIPEGDADQSKPTRQPRSSQ
jgi:hypothetical protein